MKRRNFLKAAALTAASSQRVRGANERVRIALIGSGGRGKSVARQIVEGSVNVEYAAFCDLLDSQAEQARQEFGGTAAAYRDFRDVLDLKEIDAVHIATPDHWHAIPAVTACRAGKHVYCEKPLTHNIVEGQAVVRAARENKGKVFLTGMQHRSQTHFMDIAGMVSGGELRDVHFVRIWNYVNTMPNGIPDAPNEPVPEGLDWDMYMGPAPYRAYNPRLHLRSYRYFKDLAGGMITDFGIHRFDTVHQIMGADKPAAISAAGGRFAVGGMGEHPDVLQVTYEYPGFVVSYETLSTNAFGAVGRLTPGMNLHGARGGENRPNGMAFYGSNGTIVADRLGYETLPAAPKRINEYDKTPPSGPVLERSRENNPEPTLLHGQHFIRCIREGEQPRCDALVGHRSSAAAHLGNIAYAVGRKLRWDGEKERFEADPEADKLLGRKARPPWDLIPGA